MDLNPVRISFGLGNIIDHVLTNNLNIEMPYPLIETLNKKAGINTNDEFIFDHGGVSGRFGALEGEMIWNDGKAIYDNKVISDNGMSGSTGYKIEAVITEDSLMRRFCDTWSTYTDQGIIDWNIDVMNMSVEFGWEGSTDGVSIHGNGATIFSDKRLKIQMEFDQDRMTIEFNPTWELTGVDAARRDAPEMVVALLGLKDIKYSGRFKMEIPSISDCQSYFNFQNFSKDSKCRFDIVSKDLPNPISLMMKHKFMYIKAGSKMVYIKSENRKGKLIGFNRSLYLSLYSTEDQKGKPFDTIKQNAGQDLLLTIPMMGAFNEEIIPAAMKYAMKWTKFVDNLMTNPQRSIIKAVYWMDKWAHTVEETTFDISGIIEASRIGCREYPNSQLQNIARTIASEIAVDLTSHDFTMIVALRVCVNDIRVAEKETARKFKLPA